MTGADPEAVRASWIRLLGARRDPDASWRLGEPEPGPYGTVRRRLDLRSFGALLTAELLLPDRAAGAPVVVAPWYDTASLVEPDPPGPRPAARPWRNYAERLAGVGLGVLVVPWWAEAAADPDGPTDLAGRYGPVAAAHTARFPTVTGLGRSVADLFLALDALTEVPEVDAGRIGSFGHSLGGKLSLFLAALDPRIRACVTHEPGLGLAHSNWRDPWYFDAAAPSDRDLDEVAALIAPRPLLYCGGGDSDGPHNADVLRAAQAAWSRGSEAPWEVDVLMHNGGHPLPDHVMVACATWLAGRLDVPPTGGRGR